MGLTNNSTGLNAVYTGLNIKRKSEKDKVIAVAGNPNVGKSTIFNNLTGLNQHTGNWPGKTVTNAWGYFNTEKNSYILVDIPGTYSLMAHSAEEEIARNFICFEKPDVVMVVCDGTCLERNLNLLLQICEITKSVLVCVNLLDEAKRKNIEVDLNLLSQKLGVPVVGTVARKKKKLAEVAGALDFIIDNMEFTKSIKPMEASEKPLVAYDEIIEEAIENLKPVVQEEVGYKINPRWLSLNLLNFEPSFEEEVKKFLLRDVEEDREEEFFNRWERIKLKSEEIKEGLKEKGFTGEKLTDEITGSLVSKAENIAKEVVKTSGSGYSPLDKKLDKIFTGKFTAYPIMFLGLAIIFWLTITGANYPSQFLSDIFFWGEDRLTELFMYVGAPDWLHGILVLGVYRVTAWVVSVMLPPMAIFFPLFTLLEDGGYLPRVAYNLDKPLKKCKACGKQSLTMCMGFGCNAAGVIGCRIIDSKRERLIAVITNNFVPCNGRFPTLIAIITMFFVGTGGGNNGILAAFLLAVVIVLGIIMTLVVSRVLSATVLKGEPSSFILELPPYRKPQIGSVIIRSIFDRTLFVLGRAVSVAAPAGILIFIMANVNIGDGSILDICVGYLDPLGELLGMDGVILMAFILGLPANEIVFPIIIMTYLSQGSLLEIDSLPQLKNLLVEQGWTWVTAVSVMLFSLMHWPCGTTLLTIRKETGSLKWTFLSFAIPTVMGIICCFVFATIANTLI